MKYEVTVTRTKTETSTFTVSAETPEKAEEKICAILEPNYTPMTPEQAEKAQKKAVRYFDSHAAEYADNTTEFEYETEEQS